MGGWGCPHDDGGRCLRVAGEVCNPGMKGCVLFGRFVFSTEEKNTSKRLDEKKSRLKERK